ncbi:hypothetical protein OSTOST_10766 [Ostertagia ostertagi]
MPIDQTPYFKAHVKSLTSRGVGTAGENDIGKQAFVSFGGISVYLYTDATSSVDALMRMDTVKSGSSTQTSVLWRSFAVADPSVSSLAYKKLAAHAFTLGKDLAEFRQVVLSRRCDYLSFNSPTRMMDELERDEFDRDTEKALSQFGLAIRRFSAQTAGDLLTAKEEKKHLSIVADLLSTHLKRIAKLVTDMR